MTMHSDHYRPITMHSDHYDVRLFDNLSDTPDMAGCRGSSAWRFPDLVLCLVMNLSRPARPPPLFYLVAASVDGLFHFNHAYDVADRQRGGRLSRLGCRPDGSAARRALFDLCHFRVDAVTLIYVALIRPAEATCVYCILKPLHRRSIRGTGRGARSAW